MSLPFISNAQILIDRRSRSLLQFNFVGKLLGPRGNSLKRLQEDTLTKMSILGKGSMRDKEKVTHRSVISFFSLLSVLLSLFFPPSTSFDVGLQQKVKGEMDVRLKLRRNVGSPIKIQLKSTSVSETPFKFSFFVNFPACYYIYIYMCVYMLSCNSSVM